MEITKAVQAKARRTRKQLEKAPNDDIGIMMKIIALAVECGIDPLAPSKTTKRAPKKEQA